MREKKIVFLTGTRADYGKIKSLMKKIEKEEEFDLHVFITGMHLLSKYGSTYGEIEKDGFKNIYKYINQGKNAKMDLSLSNTILGFSNYISELEPDLIVVHGDRLEALAGSIVGAFNNIRVAHIEGGEISGTIDESIRHSITKFSHIHLVSNEEARKRIIQLGEKEENIFITGSPDIDIMLSDELPTVEEVKSRYGIDYSQYAIVMYHPTTTEVENLDKNVSRLVDVLIESKENYIVIYPNNDEGSDLIFKEYDRVNNRENFEIFPSIRFEYFLTLLKNAKFVIGNSSTGIRETCVYGVPSIDIGNRQKGRYREGELKNILHAIDTKESIKRAIEKAKIMNRQAYNYFGEGKSDEKFIEILKGDYIWNLNVEKNFVDI